MPLPSPYWWVGKYDRVLITAFQLCISDFVKNSVFNSCTYTHSYQVKKHEVKRKGENLLKKLVNVWWNIFSRIPPL